MQFQSYDQLKAYVGKWLSDEDLDLVWQWIQKGMVTEEQVVEITRKCHGDGECMTDGLKKNSWKAFIMKYTGR